MTMFYTISPGTLGAAAQPQQCGSIAEAKADFKSYIADCKRHGNEYHGAQLEVNDGERSFIIGPRGGIVEV